MRNRKILKLVSVGSLSIMLSLVSVGNSVFAWSANKWEGVSDNGNGQGTGHQSMINKISDSLFCSPKFPKETDTTTHRAIVAKAAYYTDALTDIMSASANTHNGKTNYSPYHAKSEYSLTEVKQHAEFLYELARRRLVLGSKLDLESSNYSQTKDNYYGTTIKVATKNRIIDNLKELNAKMIEDGYDMSKVDHQGYMVLGVYFHLLEDIYCHWAKFTSSMVSGINANDINSSYASDPTPKTAFNATDLKTKVGSGIPMIRLKDYLKNDGLTFSYKIGSTTTKVTGLKANQAYEDNPFYYSERYARAFEATKAQLSYIMSDDGDADDFKFTTYSNVPLI